MGSWLFSHQIKRPIKLAASWQTKWHMHVEAKEQRGAVDAEVECHIWQVARSTWHCCFLLPYVCIVQCFQALSSCYQKRTSATCNKEESAGKYHLATLASEGWFTSLVSFFCFANASHQRNVQSNSTKEVVQRHPLCQNLPSDNIKIIICFCCLDPFIPTK